VKNQKSLHNTLKSVFQKNHGSKLDTTNPIVKEYLNLKNKNNLCFAPSKNLFFGTDGTISGCFAQSFILSYGKYPETNIEQAWKSTTANKIRKLTKNQYLPPACNLCYTQVLEKNYDVSYASVYDQHKEHTDYPVSMEFYLDNTCNLECIMCSPENSSLIAKKHGISKKKSPYNQKFLDELRCFIPNLKHTYFFGGEPFLIPIYFDIWEQIINSNPNCLIDITTNGTVLNEKVKSLLNKAKFNINISIDSLQKDAFESIRKNAKFETVMDNLDYFYNYCKTQNTKFFISFCPLQQNWEEIPDILNFANKLNVGLVYNRVWNPTDSAIWTLNPKNLEEIINYLEKYKFKPDNDIHNFNINGFNTLKNQIKIWHKSALDFNVKYTGKINEKQVLDLINNELNACYKENHRNFLSKIKNKKQLNERIEAINSLIKEYKLSEQEKNIFYRNIIMQKAFFINAFFFAENSDKFRKIINLIKS